MRTTLRIALSLLVWALLPACTAKVELGSTSKEAAAPDAAKTDGKQEAKPDADGKPADAGADSGIKVVRLIAGDQRDEGSKEITNTTSAFGVKSKKMYVNAGIKGLQKGAKITGTLRAVDVVTSDGAKVRDSDIVSADIEAPGEESTATFDFTAPEKGWPVGKYVVKVAVEGKQVDTIDLSVKEASE